jgi:hypothetical protein
MMLNICLFFNGVYVSGTVQQGIRCNSEHEGWGREDSRDSIGVVLERMRKTAKTFG